MLDKRQRFRVFFSLKHSSERGIDISSVALNCWMADSVASGPDGCQSLDGGVCILRDITYCVLGANQSAACNLLSTLLLPSSLYQLAHKC